MNDLKLDNYLKGMQEFQAKSLLEAKIGSYKIFDAEIITLISEGGWVADHVSNLTMYSMTTRAIVLKLASTILICLGHIGT